MNGPSNSLMVEKGLWGKPDETLQTVYGNFMKNINGTSQITDCNLPGFSCIKFSSEIVEYLASIQKNTIYVLHYVLCSSYYFLILIFIDSCKCFVTK